MNERKYEFDALPDLRPRLDKFITELEEYGGRDLVAKVAVAIASLGGLTITDLQTFTKTVPAFAKARWDEVAPKFGLDVSRDIYQLETFSVPRLSLPPSFHREVMKNSAQWLDVYQEAGSHSREAARVRLMDAWHVPVCALFKGRIVDRPEHPMPDTPQTSGGFVEHEVYMTEGIILIVIELKLYFKDLRDHFAEVLLELSSAYKLNSAKEFANQPPVYAVLTDLKDFYFLRYDGSRFTLYEHEVGVSTRSRSTFLGGMKDVTEHLFSIILAGYISTLDAIVARSYRRGVKGDVSEHNSASVGEPKLRTPSGQRPSFDNWTRALTYASSAQEALRQVNHASFGTWETSGVCGLSLLQSSVSCLSKIGSNTDWSREELEVEIDKVLGGYLIVPTD